jgi:hypothetical protein
MSITRRLRTKTGKLRRHTHSATCKHKRSKRKSMRSKRTYKKMSGGLIVF